MRDEHRIVVLQCDECGEPRAGCRDLACALVSRPYAGEDVVPAGQVRDAVSVAVERVCDDPDALTRARRAYLNSPPHGGRHDAPARNAHMAAAIRAAFEVPS